MNAPTRPGRRPVWISADSGDFNLFQQQVSQRTDPEDVPQATEVVRNIPVYSGTTVAAAADDHDARRSLTAEWAWAFADGPGIIVIRDALPDAAIVDRATEIFETIIAEERPPIGAAATTSRNPAPTTASGIRWKSTASPTRRILRPITAPQRWHWRPKPGLARPTR